MPAAPPAAASSLTSRISSSGKFLGFNSVRSLTGYDNTIPDSGEPAIEIFLYDAAAAQLRCASCDPGGSPPSAGAAIKPPARPSTFTSWNNVYPQRNVSEGGQVFFETADALLPRDVNGRRDVYEYVDGQLHLLSTGSGEGGSHFLDATPDGSSVFLSTAQRLLPRDTDTVYDYYVARVGGGFVQPAQPPPSCEGESCRGAGTGESTASPGTSSFAGRGNLRARRNCASLARRRPRAEPARQAAAPARQAGRAGRQVPPRQEAEAQGDPPGEAGKAARARARSAVGAPTGGRRSDRAPRQQQEQGAHPSIRRARA